MTVSSTTNKVVAAGNGVTTVFSYAFQINSASDVQVIYTDATGVSTTLSSTQYSITGLGSPGGGTVTYPLVGSPIATGTTLTITRQLALTQPTSVQNQGPFYPSVVESMVDRICMELQQVAEQISRTLVAPITDPSANLSLPSAAQRAGKAFLFDSSGNPIAGSLTTSSVVSSVMQPVTSAASIALGRIAMGLGGMAVEGIGKGIQDDGAGNARVNFTTEAKAINYAILSTDHLEQYVVTAPITFTLPQSSTLWNGFGFWADMRLGALILTPNAADNIEGNSTGASTYCPQGTKAWIYTNGAGAWYIARTQTNQSAVQPGGYLTLVSGSVVVPAADIVSATTLYYTPDINSLVPIYDGVNWINFPFSELSCAFNATQQLANSIHDVFVTLVSGVPTLVIGPAWRQPGFGSGGGGFTSLTNATPMVCTATGHNLQNGDVVFFSGVNTAGSGMSSANGPWVVSGVAGAAFTLTGSAGNGVYLSGTGTFASRGNGVGTTQISKNNGIYVNSVQITGYNGATPYTINAGLATYVGSVLFDSVAGQVTCHKTYGQSRRFGVWNAYNRKQISLKSGDSTATWTYTSNVARPTNNNTANSSIFFSGLAEETPFMFFNQYVSAGTGGANAYVGYATTNNITGSAGKCATGVASIIGTYTGIPTIGMATVTSLESVTTAPNSSTFSGSELYCSMTLSYRG